MVMHVVVRLMACCTPDRKLCAPVLSFPTAVCFQVCVSKYALRTCTQASSCYTCVWVLQTIVPDCVVTVLCCCSCPCCCCTRFNPKQQPSPEWSVFGSFLFLLPQLEVVEGEGALMMALNVAWDSRYTTSSAWPPGR